MTLPNEELAKVLYEMSDSCTTMPGLAHHLRQAARAALRGDGYSSNGSAKVVSHLLSYSPETLTQ